MSDVLEVDICVIGAGSGGLSVAAGASQMGASVVVVEKAAMGGECLNTGCVPSKSLLAAARMATLSRRAMPFGVRYGEPAIDHAAVGDHVRDVIAGIAPHDSQERFEALGVRVVRGAGRFSGPREVEAAGLRIRARRFVIATGSSPQVPPVPGLDGVPFFTNETIFANRRRLDHLIVLGGGPIGLEMAQAHRRLGSRVTVLEMARLLPRDDEELAGIVGVALRREGVTIVEGAQVSAVAGRPDGGIAATVRTASGETMEVTGSHLLVAAGRRPNLDGLGLEAAGIRFGGKGIEVDNRLRTSNRRVFAIGDVIGGRQFTHVAGHQAGIVLRNILFRLPARASSAVVPWVTYTDPELAWVGLNETDAAARHGAIRVLRWPFAENDRARAERDTVGLVKAITTRRGRIVGAGIVGAHAGDLLHPWTLAIANGLKIGAMASAIAPYPTRGEASKRAAGMYFVPTLFGERTRRLVRFLARFG